MALSSLIGGLFSFADSALTNGLNYSINDSTNKTNEKNVSATNAANIAMTNATNAANKQIAQDTNASNERIMRETNAFNAAQADLAYQRSTSVAKLGELISAGLSPEQARQVIASQGMTGSPSPATGTAIPAVGATMQTPQIQPFQKQPFSIQGGGLTELGKGIGDFVEDFVSASKDPSGGTIGQILCMNEFAQASDIISDVPITALKNPYSFFNWMQKEMKTDSRWSKLINSKSFQRMWNNPISRKAFMYDMNEWYGQAANEEYSLEQKRLQNNLLIAQEHSTTIDANLKNSQIFKTNAETANLNEQSLLTNYKAQREEILLNRDKALKSLITETQKAQYAKELADSQLQTKLLNDPDYRKAYFASTIGNLSAAAAEYSYVNYKYSILMGAYEDGMLDEDTIKVFTLLEDLGFDGTPTYESMLQAVIDKSTLTSYLLGKGWKFPYLLPNGSIETSSADFYNSIKNWHINMEKIRYDAMRPFFKREDIKFGIKTGVDVVSSMAMPFALRTKGLPKRDSNGHYFSNSTSNLNLEYQ